MIFLISLCVAVIFVAMCRKSLKKCPNVFYTAAVVITIVTACYSFPVAPNWIQNYNIALFRKGTLAMALFVIVMYTGALKNGSALIKLLMPIRAELSIFATILTLTHIIFYGKTYFKYLFTAPEKLGILMIVATSLSIIILFILIPLFVTSFPRIRKKMNAKKWKILQRTAYVFYALIYIHVMIFSVSYAWKGRSGYAFSAVLYSLVFLVYAAMRIRKALSKKQKPLVSNVIPFTATAAIFAVICLLTFQNVPSLSAGTAVFETSSVAEAKSSEEIAADVRESDSNNLEEVAVVTDTPEKAIPLGQTSETEVPLTSQKPAEETSTQPTEETKAEETLDDTQKEPQKETQKEYQKESVPENTQKELETQSVPATTEPAKNKVPITTSEVTATNSKYKDGTYSGSGNGFAGTVTVSIAISNDVINAITFVSTVDDAIYFDDAWAGVTSSILKSQTTSVDSVSGATFSSEGIKAAVEAALSKGLN